MSKVSTVKLPEISILHERMIASDFVDCYSVKSRMRPRKAAEIITNFPGWARLLLLIRKWVTAPFGLSNDGPPSSDKIGIFPVEAESECELVAGFNDKHLDFRVAVISQDDQIFLATWVHPNNIGGRLYLRAIMPFHVAISRNALRRVAAVSGLT